MNRIRLDQILKEIEDNPASFVKDGYLYFQEFIPVLEKALPPEAKPVAKAAPKPEPRVVTEPEKKVSFSAVLKKKK